MSPDTIVPDPANPQSFNRYSYVLNSPLNFTDPSGHIPCEQMPIECQKDSKGNEDWTIGDYATEDWHETASKVAINTIANEIQETSLIDMVSGNTSWPDWTYSRLFPDYFVVQGTALIFSGAVTVDDFSNFYVSGGLSFGAEILPPLLGGSLRVAGGWIIAEQVPSSNGLGKEWAWQTDSPTEAELEGHLRGVSVGGGIGAGPGADLSLAISSDPSLSGEGGIYSPQAGVGVTLTGFIYDAGSENPWFFQKWGVFD